MTLRPTMRPNGLKAIIAALAVLCAAAALGVLSAAAPAVRMSAAPGASVETGPLGR